MSPDEVLRQLAESGVVLMADGDRLRARPRDAITPDLRAALVEHKASLLRLLSAEEMKVRWRIEAMRSQVPRTGSIPILLARPEAKTSPRGTCVSCGDLLTEDRHSRCAPCVSAIERLLNEVREGR